MNTRLTTCAMAVAVSMASAGCERTVVILSMNDVYRVQGLTASDEGGMARIRALRAELEEEHPELLVLHGGDFLSPSLLSRVFEGRQMVNVMGMLDGAGDEFDDRMFVVFGNHEFDQGGADDAALLDELIESSGFTWLHTNLDFLPVIQTDGREAEVSGQQLARRAIVRSDGVDVGLFGLTLDIPGVPFLSVRGADSGTSEDIRVELARSMTRELRADGADLVIALTHQSERMDSVLLSLPDGPEIVIGGHTHAAGHRVDPTTGHQMVRSDSDARTVGLTRVTLRPFRRPVIETQLHPVDATNPEDADVAVRVRRWVAWHQEIYCGVEQPGCLDEPLAVLTDTLRGEELDVRSSESNLGSWVADRLLGVVPDSLAREGHVAAVVNAGALRLNQDLPAGDTLRLRHVEELIQFDDRLYALEIEGRILMEALNHSVQCRGEGPWLQVAGVTFLADTSRGGAYDVRMAGRSVAETDDIVLVVPEFLALEEAPGDQDLYVMLNGHTSITPIIANGDHLRIKDVVRAGLGDEIGDLSLPPSGRVQLSGGTARSPGAVACGKS